MPHFFRYFQIYSIYFCFQVHPDEISLRARDLKHTTTPVQRNTCKLLRNFISLHAVIGSGCSLDKPEVFVYSGQVQSSLKAESRGEGGAIRCLFYLRVYRLSVRCPGAAQVALSSQTHYISHKIYLNVDFPLKMEQL